jgi:hypothetical protein
MTNLVAKLLQLVALCTPLALATCNKRERVLAVYL